MYTVYTYTCMVVSLLKYRMYTVYTYTSMVLANPTGVPSRSSPRHTSRLPPPSTTGGWVGGWVKAYWCGYECTGVGVLVRVWV